MSLCYDNKVQCNQVQITRWVCISFIVRTYMLFYISQVDTLMANIGGTLGLFMGISFVTAFEFLEFIVDMIVLALYKAKQKGKTTPANDHA